MDLTAERVDVWAASLRDEPGSLGAVLGHASPAVTMAVYAHALSHATVEATNAIATAVGGGE